MKSILIYAFLLLMPTLALGQSRLYVIDPPSYEIGRRMEQDFTRAINHIALSYSSNRYPSWNNLNEINASFKNDINNIWKTSSIRIDVDTLYRPAYTLSGGNFEIRDIPISLVNKDTIIYEDAVLLFYSQGKLTNFIIGLPQHRWMHYMNEATEVIDKTRRQTILNFVEQYRTAYNTRNIELIEQVFSEQALIIVGNVIKTSSEMVQFQDKIQYLKLTKQEYIKRLNDIFRTNDFVNVKFNDLSVLRHPKHPSIYGVAFVQNFRSSKYSDDGYVFLLIDFRRDENNPIIHVRTWQPTKETPKDRVFQLGDIEIY